MSDAIVLERSPMRVRSALKDRFIASAEQTHKKNIADNYRKLAFQNAEAYNSAKEGDVIEDNFVPAAPAPKAETPTAAASRMAQYTAVDAPAGKHRLFEGVTYKDGVLQVPQQPAESAVESVTVAPAAPATSAADEEDAIPTRRTMDTLNRPAAMQTEEALAETATHAVLSTRMKAALIAVAATVLLAIIVICICSSVIRSINAGIADRQLRLEELMRETQQVQEQIADLTSPESIAEWAAEHNMVRE